MPHSDTDASATPADACSADACSSDTSLADVQHQHPSSLRPATAESAGLDLHTSTTVTLNNSSIHLLPTGIFGPLGPQKSALLLGKSSNSLPGLSVFPVVMDLNFKDELKIIVWTSNPPCFIPQGTCVAKLIPLPHDSPSIVEQYNTKVGESGFVMTPQILWTQTISDKHPTCQCTLSLQGQQITLTSILDTGADITVISQDKWPSNWALMEVPMALTGIGGSSRSYQSRHLIQVTGRENHTASVRPFVLPVPIVLWGQDVLSQWGFRIQLDF